MIRALCLMLALTLAVPAGAVTPDEILDDPVLEERARELSKGIRCLVCRNESIDESHAELAKDLRILVRERLVLGDSDAEVLDFLVQRYGEYVLLTPQKNGANILLWYAGPFMALVGLGTAAVFVRSRRKAGPEVNDTLSAADAKRVAELMGDD